MTSRINSARLSAELYDEFEGARQVAFDVPVTEESEPYLRALLAINYRALLAAARASTDTEIL